MGPSAAYRMSRDTSRMATATVNANAKKLDRKSEIKVRIEELRRRESRESSTAGESSEESPGVSGLTPKREAFLQKYLETSNASEAYRQVYDVAPDTKPETIARNAHAILAGHQDSTKAGRAARRRGAAPRDQARRLARRTKKHRFRRYRRSHRLGRDRHHPQREGRDRLGTAERPDQGGEGHAARGARGDPVHRADEGRRTQGPVPQQAARPGGDRQASGLVRDRTTSRRARPRPRP